MPETNRPTGGDFRQAACPEEWDKIARAILPLEVPITVGPIPPAPFPIQC